MLFKIYTSLFNQISFGFIEVSDWDSNRIIRRHLLIPQTLLAGRPLCCCWARGHTLTDSRKTACVCRRSCYRGRKRGWHRPRRRTSRSTDRRGRAQSEKQQQKQSVFTSLSWWTSWPYSSSLSDWTWRGSRRHLSDNTASPAKKDGQL